MSALAGAAGINFRITADGSQASSEMKKVEGEIAASGASAASSFYSIVGGATVAVTAIAAVGAAAVGAAVSIFNLAKSAADYGSALFDFQEKTGLSAATIGTLKFAADNAGSSLDGLNVGISKFAKNVGSATEGNERQIKAMKELGVTSSDLNTALAQTIKTIYEADTGTKQITLAQKAFGRSGAELIPVIKQLGGDLSAATTEAKRLGQTLTNEDLKAADNFGDTLGLLSSQAKNTASVFALQFAPVITDAMHRVSESLASNSADVRTYGQNFANVLRGMELAATSSTAAMIGSFAKWAANIFSFIDPIQRALIGTVRLLQQVGAMNPVGVKGGSGSPNAAEWERGNGVEFPASGGGSGGGGGGGKGGSGADDSARKAEEARKSANAMLANDMRERFELFSEEDKKEALLQEASLQRQEINQKEFIRNMAFIRINALENEKSENKNLLEDSRFTYEERGKILHKIDVLDKQIGNEKIKLSNEIVTQIAKETDAENKLFEAERKRLNEQRNRRANDAQKAREQELHDLQDRQGSSSIGNAGFAGGIAGSIGIMADMTVNAADKMAAALNGVKATWSSFKDTVKGAIDGIVSGLESMISAWLLGANTGDHAMRKMVATVLAGVAAQSAVLAIFELAKGFAALFWNPAEAAMHFHAAALFGTIAVGTGIAAHATAGNLFKDQGGSSGAGAGASQTPQNNHFGTQFNGFGNTANQLNVTVAALEETVNTLSQRLNGISPGHVLEMGAKENPDAIVSGYHSGLGNDGRSTEGLARNTGQYR